MRYFESYRVVLSHYVLVAIDGEDVTGLSVKEVVRKMDDKREKGCNLTVNTTVRQECRSVGTI